MVLQAIAELPCVTFLSGAGGLCPGSRRIGMAVSTPKMPKSLLQVQAQHGSNQSSEEESRAVLDAFFLGKAFAEAVTDRLSSALGEFLSHVGRMQAEQQKTVREFQEEVEDRARKAIVREVVESARGSSKRSVGTPQPESAGVIERSPGVDAD
eukprot:TRINITY_DN26713_c0_g1_i1.p1 TRINITY_DN26713_c0_g1~~TRINITY_DN26713_c0_g1_i1.p1  ORF type:complete len:153 (+),score=28.70 TRINITY_DN26713_c0_g1_i1:95-553(+)